MLHVPDAAKSASECSLHQLSHKKDKKAINLFVKKRIKGWWPVFEQKKSDDTNVDDDSDNKELTVRDF